jgi:hypothetical protein
VTAALEQIARDVRHRYTVSYESSNARRDGTYRRVRVAASKPGEHHPLRVRTRAGYVAPVRMPEP